MIYVHVPFCKSFCTYCGFYSQICSAGRTQEVQSRYVDCLLGEISERRDDIDRVHAAGPRTLYFGGGTPSTLSVDSIRRIVEALGYFDYDEFTVEVNPDDVTPHLVRSLKDCGVNRVSMGVQSLDDKTLRWMNRRHDSATAISALRILKEEGIANVSVDLIFGLPGLGDEMWREEIRRVVSLRPEHISAYALSIEPDSVLSGMVEKGTFTPAGEEQYSAQYEILCQELAGAGYDHYEISNFALPGFQALHNSSYWSGRSYVGLGPGAHSFDRELGKRSWNTEVLEGWTREGETLGREEQRIEEIMLSLRTSLGLQESRLRELAGEEKTDRCISQGSVVRLQDGRVRIPESRFFVSEAIISDLI